MTEFAKISRSTVVRTSRETVALAAAAGAVALALAYAHHARIAAEPAPQPRQTSAKEWVGHLPSVAPSPPAAAAPEPMTSASLVVAPSQIPQVIVPSRQPAKARGCDAPPCPLRSVASTGVAPTPPVRPPVVAAAPFPGAPSSPKPTLVARLNPLNHLPDVDALARPFTYVGDKMSGWFHRL